MTEPQTLPGPAIPADLLAQIDRFTAFVHGLTSEQLSQVATAWRTASATRAYTEVAAQVADLAAKRGRYDVASQTIVAADGTNRSMNDIGVLLGGGAFDYVLAVAMHDLIASADYGTLTGWFVVPPTAAPEPVHDVELQPVHVDSAPAHVDPKIDTIPGVRQRRQSAVPQGERVVPTGVSASAPVINTPSPVQAMRSHRTVAAPVSAKLVAGFDPRLDPRFATLMTLRALTIVLPVIDVMDLAMAGVSVTMKPAAVRYYFTALVLLIAGTIVTYTWHGSLRRKVSRATLGRASER